MVAVVAVVVVRWFTVYRLDFGVDFSRTFFQYRLLAPFTEVSVAKWSTEPMEMVLEMDEKEKVPRKKL